LKLQIYTCSIHVRPYTVAILAQAGLNWLVSGGVNCHLKMANAHKLHIIKSAITGFDTVLYTVVVGTDILYEEVNSQELRIGAVAYNAMDYIRRFREKEPQGTFISDHPEWCDVIRRHFLFDDNIQFFTMDNTLITPCEERAA
jgi:hypothetical protein